MYIRAFLNQDRARITSKVCRIPTSFIKVQIFALQFFIGHQRWLEYGSKPEITLPLRIENNLIEDHFLSFQSQSISFICNWLWTKNQLAWFKSFGLFNRFLYLYETCDWLYLMLLYHNNLYINISWYLTRIEPKL